MPTRSPQVMVILLPEFCPIADRILLTPRGRRVGDLHPNISFCHRGTSLFDGTNRGIIHQTRRLKERGVVLVKIGNLYLLFTQILFEIRHKYDILNPRKFFKPFTHDRGRCHYMSTGASTTIPVGHSSDLDATLEHPYVRYLRTAMQREGLSPDNLAARSGISKGTVSLILNG